MNVYDFDKTIYRRDSSTDFVLYLFRRRPALLRYVPSQLAAAFRHYVLHRITKTQMKERFFSLFAACSEGAAPYVTDFWAGHWKHLLAWYRRQQRADDLIISASPRFLLEPVCRELGVTRLIASEVDPKNGRFTGLNCHGQEKLHLLEGLQKILLDIDKAIAIVRNTEEESEVVPNLMIGFGIDEVQAEYVAEIKLRHLNREYILKRLKDIDDLKENIAEMEDILAHKAKIKKIIVNELKGLASGHLDLG